MDGARTYLTVVGVTIACWLISAWWNVGCGRDNEVWLMYIGTWGNLETDGKWIHWRIRKPELRDAYFEPPESIPSVHFPSLGLYSSYHEETVGLHMKAIREAGVDAVIVYWFGKDRAPADFRNEQDSLSLIFKCANKHKVKVGIMIPDYENRTVFTLDEDIQLYLDSYTSSSNLLTRNNLPVILIENSARISNVTVNHKEAFIIATGTSNGDLMDAYENGFQGFATYWVSKYESYYSDFNVWESESSKAMERGMLFIPTTSPGYNSTSLSIQNSFKSVSRNNGCHYDMMWDKAISTSSPVVLINSFNNWVQGTSIEPVVNHPKFPLNADIWGPSNQPEFFMKKTKHWTKKYKR